MKTILLFGAGKSATVLIDYLLANAETENWQLIIADANVQLATQKLNNSPHGKAMGIDITDSEKRASLISEADLVISMLPPALHALVAADCLQNAKHLLTASYVDDTMKTMAAQIKEKDVLFLCEMGLDPGIDHMSAMQLIDAIKSKGGQIHSFQSHCGGLVAPESDDNPWHYKISWNPRNIVLAGKAGAHYKKEGKEVFLKYEELFDPSNNVKIGEDLYSWYANRDSLGYASLYGLEGAKTFIRTTLRHPDFMYGWKNIIDLELTDEIPAYETDNKTLQEVFKLHMDKHGFSEWLTKKMTASFSQAKEMLENLMKLMETQNKAEEEGIEIEESFLAADEEGNIQEVNVEEVKSRGAAQVAMQMHNANLLLKQLFFLGMDDDETKVNKGLCSPADLLQFSLEKKLALQPDDKDMIVMLHELDYELKGQLQAIKSSLIVKGENALHTAMAKTVGLPLGIAAKMILNGTIKLRGLQIPTTKEIYAPVLKELEKYGIVFKED